MTRIEDIEKLSYLFVSLDVTPEDLAQTDLDVFTDHIAMTQCGFTPEAREDIAVLMESVGVKNDRELASLLIDMARKVVNPALSISQDKPVSVKLSLVSTTPGQADFILERATVMVTHAFGDNAKYKGRNIEHFVSFRPEGLKVTAEFDASARLSDVLSAVVSQQIDAVAIAVEPIEQIEKEKQEEVKKKIEKQMMQTGFGSGL